MATQIIDLGSLRFVFNGAYSSIIEYQLNDVVKSDNKLYIYVNEIPSTGSGVGDLTYWALAIDGFADPATGTAGQIATTDGTNIQYVSDISVGEVEAIGDVAGLGAIFGGAGAKLDYSTLGTSVVPISTKQLTSNVATITTTAPHGFSPFQIVNIVLEVPDAAFDGEQEILDVPTTTSFTFAKTAGDIANAAAAGTASAIPGYTNAVAVFHADAADYAQVAFRNANAGANASTDFIAYADNGDDFAGYVDMGITSSGFNDPAFTITGENDGYIFMSAPAGTTGNGDLILATNDTGVRNAIVFAAGGLGSNNTQMTIYPDDKVHIEIPTPSTSSTTGALTVAGGVGIAGDMNIAGDVAIVGSISFGGGSTTSENLSVSSPVVFSGNGATGDTNDLGFVGEYKVGATTKYSGLVRDHSDGVVKLFKDLTTKPTTTTDFAGAVDGDLKVGNLTATGGVSISGTSDIQEMREQLVPVTISANSAACDWTAGNIYYIETAPTANFTVALTNVPADNNKIMTVNVMVVQGATGYIPNALSIGGVTQTIKWPAAAAPVPTSSAGKMDIFSFTLIRTGSAWIVLGGSNLNY